MRGGGTLVPCTLLPVYTSVSVPLFYSLAFRGDVTGGRPQSPSPVSQSESANGTEVAPPGQWGRATRGTLLSWQKRETLITSEKKQGGHLRGYPHRQSIPTSRIERSLQEVIEREFKQRTQNQEPLRSTQHLPSRAQPKKEGRRKAPSAPPESTGRQRQTTTC